jgi:hypothetical protein
LKSQRSGLRRTLDMDFAELLFPGTGVKIAFAAAHFHSFGVALAMEHLGE